MAEVNPTEVVAVATAAVVVHPGVKAAAAAAATLPVVAMVKDKAATVAKTVKDRMVNGRFQDHHPLHFLI